MRNGPPSLGPLVDRPSRSPPPSPSPPHPPASLAGLSLPPAAPPLVDAGIDAFTDQNDDEVESDAFSDEDNSIGSEFSWEGRCHAVDAWLPPSRYDVLERLLFTYIDPSLPIAEVNGFLHAALAIAEPSMLVEFSPSSWGAMLFRCRTLADRDLLRGYSPIVHEGTELTMQCLDECSNCFYHVPPWLGYVHVDNFLEEHWDEDKIKATFHGFCEVMEIDPTCLTGDNFGPLRLLLKVNVRLKIPYYVRVSARHGRGFFGVWLGSSRSASGGVPPSSTNTVT